MTLAQILNDEKTVSCSNMTRVGDYTVCYYIVKIFLSPYHRSMIMSHQLLSHMLHLIYVIQTLTWHLLQLHYMSITEASICLSPIFTTVHVLTHD